MKKSIRRYNAEKELRLSRGYVFTRKEYSARGVQYIGTLGQAAKLGFFTPAGCDRLNMPVSEVELENVKFCAMFADCYQDQTIIEDGRHRRPCLPVFQRDTSKNQTKPQA